LIEPDHSGANRPGIEPFSTGKSSHRCSLFVVPSSAGLRRGHLKHGNLRGILTWVIRNTSSIFQTVGLFELSWPTKIYPSHLYLQQAISQHLASIARGQALMPISLVCPGCKKTLKVADTLAGKRAKCPGCQTPVTIPGLGTPQPAAAPKAAPSTPAPAKKNAADDWDLGLAPLDDEPKPKPAPQKPAATTSKPTSTKTTTPTAAKPAPPEAKKPAPPKKTSPELEDFGLAPLEDDPIPKPVPAAKKPTAAAAPPAASKPPVAAAPKVGSAPKPTAKIPTAKVPVARSADENEEQDFNLQPLAELHSELPGADPLGMADPLGIAPPMNAAPLPKQTNPYLASQAALRSNSAPSGSLPIGKSLGEFFNNYAQYFGHSVVFGVKAMAILLGFTLGFYGLSYAVGYTMANAEAHYSTMASVGRLMAIAFLIGLFFVQCWLGKALLYYGYCVAHHDHNGIENALNSPGSLVQFIMTCVINAVILVVIGAGFYFGGALANPFLLLGGFFVLLMAVNLIGLNLMFYFEMNDVNFFSVFDKWAKVVAPHIINYSIVLMITGLLGTILQAVVVYGLKAFFEAVQYDLMKIMPSDPQIRKGILSAVMLAISYGVFGTYYSILQGVSFKRMMKLYRGHEEEE
jgi:hypothetical protein